MSTKYKFRDQDKLYFITFAVVNWIDLFTRNEYKEIMLKSWEHCKEHKGLEIYGWCMMTNHIHMIIGTHGDRLENIMRDMKKQTLLQLKRAIKEHPQESRREWILWMMERAGKKNSQNIEFQLWQQDNHPIELFNHQVLHQKLDYMHNNPVVAGIVEKPEDYLYSSAPNYIGLPGLIKVTLVDPLVM
ncbi:transposase [Mucilaginibacter sp. PAMC 26640]|nr:transposase [Mucilaginibacter sp. PAMC 26640]